MMFIFLAILVVTPVFSLAGDIVESSSTTTTIKEPITLKPGEQATVVTRKVVTIKTTTDIPSPIESPSWRCKNIPDQAFNQLGTYAKGKHDKSEWEMRAGDFIATYGANCPNYAALERELPPYLNQKKYTQMLSVMFELNKMLRPEVLLRLAREDEVLEHQKSLERKPASVRGKQSFLEAFNEEHQKMIRKSEAAKILLDVKFPEEVKSRYEAHRFVLKFGTDFLDKRGNVRTENFKPLKNLLKTLTPQQKVAVRNYLVETLNQREYPKSNLVPTKDEEMARAKQRNPASLTKKEAGNRAVIQLLLFEVD